MFFSLENLDQLAKLWGESSFDENQFKKITDGKYQAKVNTARIESSKSGKLMIKYDLIIVGSEFDGRHLFHNRLIDTPEHVGWARTELHKLGYGHATIQEMQQSLQSMLDSLIEVTVKNRTDSDSPNIYLNKTVSKAGEWSAPDANELPVDPF